MYISSYRNIDDIDNMIDDIVTSQEFSQEISEAICNPVRLETDEDEVWQISLNLNLKQKFYLQLIICLVIFFDGFILNY